MPKRSLQLKLLAKEKSAYGGNLLKTRAGRRHGRPLTTRETMHLVLRSSKAKGEWSFRRTRNDEHVRRIIEKFSMIYSIRVISLANVGNHLHLQIKLFNRFTYKPFIRAVTAAIAMAITGRNRWTRTASETPKEKFWDYRPFTRIVESFKGYLGLKDYVRINQLEGVESKRDDARFMLQIEKVFVGSVKIRHV